MVVVGGPPCLSQCPGRWSGKPGPPGFSWAAGTTSALAAVMAGAAVQPSREGSWFPQTLPESSPRQAVGLAPTWSGHVSPAPLPAGVWLSSWAACPPPTGPRMGEFGEKSTTCGTVCLKYLLFTFNCCFWVSSGHPLPRPRRSLAGGPRPGPDVLTGVHCPQLAGLAVMAVGIWTLALKSDYISLLASGTYLATAYILVVAGIVVMVTGALGCCATFKERRNLLRLVSRACCTEGGGGAPCQAARGWFWVRRA